MRANFCPDEGILRAHLDGEIGLPERAELEQHLAECPDCRATLIQLEEQADFARMQLSAIRAPKPAVRAAWHRFDAHQRELAGQSPIGALMGRLYTMWQVLRYRHWRVGLASTLAVTLLLAVTTVAPLRAAADRFLSVFRVQKFAVVQFDSSQMEGLREFSQQVVSEPVVTDGTSTEVETAGQAGELAGFRVLEPDRLPAGAETRTKLVVEGARTAEGEVNVAAARALLEAAGLPTDALPADMERVTVSADIPAGVEMRYGSGATGVEIVQAPSPQVHVPDGLDMVRLGEIGFQLLGLPAEQAASLSRSIDWGTTLVIPVPSSMGEARQVPLQGTTGYIISERRGGRGDNTVVFWEKDGILYAVGGRISPEQLVEVAESLK